MRDKILVIDDEPNLRMILEAILLRAGYEVFCFEGFEAAKPVLNTESIDVVLTDLQMPVASGMDVLNYCKQYTPDLPVVLITAYGTVEKAVSALKAGAFDFVLKPFEQENLLQILSKAIQSRKQRKKEPALEMMSAVGVGPVPFPLFGTDPSTVKLRSDVERTSKTNAPVLMYGEVGTGKRSIAYEIHRHSEHSRGPFLQLQTDAIPEMFQLTELMGVEKGASPVNFFSKPGSLELALGGTLLIEEINAFSIEAQNALFSALENEYFTRVGGLKKFPMDLKIIATSSQDLSDRVKDGRFHVELFYKLSVEQLHLKPLRERSVDIETSLLPFLLERACVRLGRPQLECSAEVIHWFKSQSWPGNLGELERKVQQVVNRVEGNQIELKDL